MPATMNHGVQLAILAVVGGLLLWRYWRFLGDFYRFAKAYLVLFAVVVLLYLVVYGQVGTGLGLPKLFWSEDILTRIASAWASTLLLAFIGTLAYYLDPHPYRTVHKTTGFFGVDADATNPPPPPIWVGPSYPNTIRLSWFLHAARLPFLLLLIAPAVLPDLFTSVPDILPFGVPFNDLYGSVDEHAFRRYLQHPDRYELRYALSVAIWLAGILAGVYTFRLLIKVSEFFTDVDRVRRRARAPHPPALGERRGLRRAADWIGLPIPAERGDYVAARLDPCDRHDCPPATCPVNCSLPGEAPRDCLADRMRWAAIRNLIVVFGLFYIACATILYDPLPGFEDSIISPSVAIAVALAVLAMTVTLIAYLQPRRTILLGLLVLGWIWLWNNNLMWPYKLRFEHMATSLPETDDPKGEGYYGKDNQITLRREVYRVYYPETFRRHREDIGVAHPFLVPEGTKNNVETLIELWAQKPSEGRVKPKSLLLNDDVLGAWYGSVTGGRAPEDPVPVRAEDVTVQAAPDAGPVPEPDSAGAGGDADKPKLVVVCVSGGGMRSAYWTAVVLDRLAAELALAGEDIGDHVRLISGASGGMLGAACYVEHLHRKHRLEAVLGSSRAGAGEEWKVAALADWERRWSEPDGWAEEDPDTKENVAVVNWLKTVPDDELDEFARQLDGRADPEWRDEGPARKRSVIEEWVRGAVPLWVGMVPVDSLDEVARFSALRSLPFAMMPRRAYAWAADDRELDRGTELERTWPLLEDPFHPGRGRQFQDYVGLEGAGTLPSLVVSPMIVEDGRLLLISNLDLRTTVRARAESLDRQGGPPAESAGEVDRPIERVLAFTDGSKITDRVVGNAGRYALWAPEFFKLFPAARDFQVRTAVRMNATFPLISPAVNLPTIPPRRVVDAGYFDNYGVKVAVAWVHMNREWLRTNTSGVLLVQIRDSMSIMDRFEINDAAGSFWGHLLGGFQLPFSPIDAVLKARYTSTSFANDHVINLLSDEFTQLTGGDRAFFSTLVLENAATLAPFDPDEDRRWPGYALVGIEDDADQLPPGLIGDEATDQVALNWYLTATEREAIRDALPDEVEDWTEPEAARRERLELQRRERNGEADAEDIEYLRGLEEQAACLRYRRCEQIKSLERLVVERRGELREYTLKQLVRARNYDRLVLLHDWWRRRPGESLPNFDPERPCRGPCEACNNCNDAR